MVLLDIGGTLFSDAMQRMYLQKTDRHRKEMMLKRLEIVSLAVPVMPFNGHFDFVSA